MPTPLDAAISLADNALRTVYASHHPQRACPQGPIADADLSEDERREAAALMRVNHVGEVCAQALYNAQAWATQNAALKAHFIEASQEETDHLAWTEQRLTELGGRTSLLNPFWYAGAFGIGLLAGKLGGDRVSLGFVVETERQVEAHLQSHMDLLPPGDSSSRAIVQQMKADEVRHAVDAQKAGALELPSPVKSAMRMAAKVMTTVAHRI
jgi:ubiquinone biosynthesis monooxygenase Coq7